MAEQAQQQQDPSPDQGEQATEQCETAVNSPQPDLQRLLKIRMPVIVSVATRSMEVSEIMGLGLGAVIEFEKASDAELELLINNKVIASGEAVKVGENFGIKLNRTASAQEAIRSLGGLEDT